MKNFSWNIAICLVAIPAACAPGKSPAHGLSDGHRLLAGQSPAYDGAPTVFWISGPVLPGETALACGAGLGKVQSLKLRGGESLEIVQRSDRNIAFRLPNNLKPGPLQALTNTGEVWTINAPEPYWAQAFVDRDNGGRRMLRVFGRGLVANGKPPKLVIAAGQGSTQLAVKSASEYEVDAELPPSVQSGEHVVKVEETALGGETVTGATTVNVDDAAPKPALALTFAGTADGKTDVSDQLQADLTQAGTTGGGIVKIPAGRYFLSKPISVPEGVGLMGDSEGGTFLLFVSNDETPPPRWVDLHRRTAISQMTIVSNDYRYGLTSAGAGDEDDILIDHVRLHFVRFAAMGAIADIEKRMEGMKKYPNGRGDVISLTGAHCEISHCEIYSTDGITLAHATDAWVHDNTIGIGHLADSRLSGVRKLIMERNVIEGDDPTAGAGFQLAAPNGHAVSEDICFQGNTFRQFNGNNREALTSDSPGGLFYGAVVSASGTKLKVDRPADAVDEKWISGGVYVMAGRGAGQYREITRLEGGDVEVDRPWQVSLDQSSMVSIAPIVRHVLVLDNRFTDCGPAIQFYGSSIEAIMDGNQGQRVESFVNSGRPYSKARIPQPSWYVQWIRNSISESADFIEHSHKFYLAPSYLGAISSSPDDEPTPLMTGGIVIRKNSLKDGANLLIGSQPPRPKTDFDGAVVEDNVIDGADIAIRITGKPANVFLKGNQTPHCRTAVKDDRAN